MSISLVEKECNSLPAKHVNRFCNEGKYHWKVNCIVSTNQKQWPKGSDYAQESNCTSLAFNTLRLQYNQGHMLEWTEPEFSNPTPEKGNAAHYIHYACRRELVSCWRPLKYTFKSITILFCSASPYMLDAKMIYSVKEIYCQLQNPTFCLKIRCLPLSQRGTSNDCTWKRLEGGKCFLYLFQFVYFGASRTLCL